MFYHFIYLGQEVPNETKGTINLNVRAVQFPSVFLFLFFFFFFFLLFFFSTRRMLTDEI